MSCSITGEPICKCRISISVKQPSTMKETLRKLWSNYAIYTKFVIIDMIEEIGNIVVDGNRLLQHLAEIATFITSVIGETHGAHVSVLLKQHIIHVGECTKAIIMNDSESLEEHATGLATNTKRISIFFYQLSPSLYIKEEIYAILEEHNQHIMDLIIAQYHHDYQLVSTIFDAYYTYILYVSDIIYEILSSTIKK